MPLVLPGQRWRALASGALGPPGAPHSLRHDVVQLRLPEHSHGNGDAGHREDVWGAPDPDNWDRDGGVARAGVVFCVRDDDQGLLAPQTAVAR